VSRIKKYKNMQLLIEALPLVRDKVPDVELTIAGGGDYLPQLKALAQRKGLAQWVHFPGRITEEQKRDLLSRATLFVNPSAKEGWGITSIEANMCGTVAIASDVAGLRDSVRDGETGLLFEFNNLDLLVEHTVGLLTDSQRRTKMELAAGEFARSLGWDQMARRMGDVLAGACDSSSESGGGSDG
jgi:glycosyltransferase involved in cell wall biosynthesis